MRNTLFKALISAPILSNIFIAIIATFVEAFPNLFITFIASFAVSFVLFVLIYWNQLVFAREKWFYYLWLPLGVSLWVVEARFLYLLAFHNYGDPFDLMFPYYLSAIGVYACILFFGVMRLRKKARIK